MVWRDAVAVGLFTALAFAFFVHTWSSPATRHVGAGGDSIQAMWFLKWEEYALAHGRNPLFSSYLNAPYGVNLMWNASMPLVGVVLSPLIAVLGLMRAYNLFVTLSFAASGTAAYYLFRKRVRGGRVPAFVGAIFYEFSPYMRSHGLGHANLTAAFIPPLVFAAYDEGLVCAQKPAWRTGMVMGLLLGAQLLIFEETVASTVLVGGILTLILVVMFHRAAWSRRQRALAVAGVAAAAFVAVTVWPLFEQFVGRQRIAHARLQPPDVFVNDGLSFVVPTSIERLAPHRFVQVSGHFTGNVSEWSGYLGLPLIALLVFVIVRSWRRPLVRVLSLLALVLMVLSLGPHLHVGGRVLDVVLPWRLIDPIPLLNNLLPNRLMLYVDLIAAYLIALFVESLVTARGRRMAIGLVALSAALTPLVPRASAPTTTVAVPAFFRSGALVRVRQGSVALTEPFARFDAAKASMLWQATSDFRYRSPDGYFFGPDEFGRGSGGPRLAITEHLVNLTSRGRLRLPLSATLRERVLDDLARWGVRTVIVGPMPHRAAVVALFRSALGGNPESVDGVSVWWDIQPLDRSVSRG